MLLLLVVVMLLLPWGRRSYCLLLQPSHWLGL
jgi:hypothetical protein